MRRSHPSVPSKVTRGSAIRATLTGRVPSRTGVGSPVARPGRTAPRGAIAWPWLAGRLHSRAFPSRALCSPVVRQYRDLFAKISHVQEHFAPLAEQPGDRVFVGSGHDMIAPARSPRPRDAARRVRLALSGNRERQPLRCYGDPLKSAPEMLVLLLHRPEGRRRVLDALEISSAIGGCVRRRP
jgi:hypothetical protein